MSLIEVWEMPMEDLGSLDVRIPTWEEDDLISTPCPLCRSDTRDIIGKRPDGLVVNLCEKCGLLYVSPRPSDGALGRFYSDYARLHTEDDYASEDYWTAVLNSQSALALSDPRMSFLISQDINLRGIRVLDIGCGNGSFLLKCRRLGASSVVGVEPDKGMAIAAKRHLDIEIHNGYLEDLPRENGLFGLIVLWQVLEHLSNPCQVMRLIHERLEPDGVIAVSMPNAGEFNAQGIGWTGFRVDYDHMCYYTKEVAAFLFESCNLHLVTATPFGYPALNSPSITGREQRTARTSIFDSIRMVPPLAAILTKLYSTRGVIENKGRSASGSYVLFLLGRKKSQKGV
jgi:2-polyprenyl-3-methyl-5-hydroxy-6-metoxy-1,4-benzoquinol methylase